MPQALFRKPRATNASEFGSFEGLFPTNAQLARNPESKSIKHTEKVCLIDIIHGLRPAQFPSYDLEWKDDEAPYTKVWKMCRIAEMAGIESTGALVRL